MTQTDGNSQVHSKARRLVWRLARVLHGLDFAWVLPVLAKLPLAWGYRLSCLRGKANALLSRDWRSMALGYRHIRRQSLKGLQLLPLEASERQLLEWRNERFEVEARDEFEARLVAASRVNELACRWECVYSGGAALPAQRGPQPTEGRGLMLLTPHFDSFFLGVAFVARSGGRVNLMSSAVTHDPRVDDAVKTHFTAKYRGLESFLNGGQVLDMEAGLRPFYRMLEAGETLVVLGDAPVLPKGVAVEVPFLGGQRRLAGGALRMAQKVDADLGGFVCQMEHPGHYVMRWCEPGPARDAETVKRVYGLLGDAILQKPGHWWGCDLLPNLPLGNDASEASMLGRASYAVLQVGGNLLTGTRELAFGLGQLQKMWPGESELWRTWPKSDGSEWLRHLLSGPVSYLLVLAEPAVLGTAGLPDELARALAAMPNAVCALADDARFARGHLAAGYATRADLETYVTNRQGLTVAVALDDEHRDAKPLVFMLDLHRLRADAALREGLENHLEPAEWPQWLAWRDAAILAPRAYVHGYVDYQQGDRAEMLELLPDGVYRLLDVGGGEGGFLQAFVKERHGVGLLVEPGKIAAQRARSKGLQVIELGVEQLNPDEVGVFDAVSFLDVLEHLTDPLVALKAARQLLTPDGVLLVSVPNVGHWPVVRDLMAGRFDYLPVGILCETHLRFFTADSLQELLESAGFALVDLRRHAPPAGDDLMRWLAAAEAAGLAVDRCSLETASLHVVARRRRDC